MINLNRIIFNESVDSEYPQEEDEEAIFGKWLSPNYRGLPVYEPNTVEERDMIDSLESYLVDNDSNKLDAQIPIIQQLLASKQYKQVFDPGN